MLPQSETLLPKSLVLIFSSHFLHFLGILHLAGRYELVVATFIGGNFPANVQVVNVTLCAACWTRMCEVWRLSSCKNKIPTDVYSGDISHIIIIILQV